MSNFKYVVLKTNGCDKATIAAYKKYERLASEPNKDASWEARWNSFVYQDNGFGLAMVAINLIAKKENERRKFK